MTQTNYASICKFSNCRTVALWLKNNWWDWRPESREQRATIPHIWKKMCISLSFYSWNMEYVFAAHLPTLTQKFQNNISPSPTYLLAGHGPVFPPPTYLLAEHGPVHTQWPAWGFPNTGEGWGWVCWWRGRLYRPGHRRSPCTLHCSNTADVKQKCSLKFSAWLQVHFRVYRNLKIYVHLLSITFLNKTY